MAQNRVVNAHTHTEWFAASCQARGDGMVPWLRRVLALGAPDGGAGVARAVEILGGIDLFGDYGRYRSAVREGKLAGRFYREIIREIDRVPTDDAIAPHAIHTVLHSVLKSFAGYPGFVSVHAGESDEEMELYRTGSGPLAELLIERGFPKNHIDTLTGSSPIEILAMLKLLGPRTQIVHAIHLTRVDLELIAQRNAHIVLCPVSNRDIGTAFTAATMKTTRESVLTMIELGISLAIGTDSPLSCTTVSLEENARLVESLGIDRSVVEAMLHNTTAVGL